MTKHPPKILTKPKVNYKQTRKPYKEPFYCGYCHTTHTDAVGCPVTIKPKGSSGHSLSAVLQFVRR